MTGDARSSTESLELSLNSTAVATAVAMVPALGCAATAKGPGGRCGRLQEVLSCSGICNVSGSFKPECGSQSSLSPGARGYVQNTGFSATLQNSTSGIQVGAGVGFMS